MSLIISRGPGQKIRKHLLLIRKVLSPMENKVLDYYLRGYGYVKIAEIMGKTPKSIDNALQRIRGKIRNFSAPVQK